MKVSGVEESTVFGSSEKTKDAFKEGYDSFYSQITKSEGKEFSLLKHKYEVSVQVIDTLRSENRQLVKEKDQLLALNAEYIASLNVLTEIKNRSTTSRGTRAPRKLYFLKSC